MNIDPIVRGDWKHSMRHYFYLPLLLIILSFPSIFSQTTIAEMYKWEDENGVVHLQDFPPSHVQDSEVEQVSNDGSLSVAKPVQPKIKFKPGSEVVEVKQTKRHPEVEIYITNWCRYCRKAIAFLNAQGVPYKAYDIEKDKEAAKRKMAVAERGVVPFAVINGKNIMGFSESSYRQALDMK